MAVKRKYRGIAVFGAPGSGKTTIAALLSSAFSSAHLVEASGAVIQPATAYRRTLPTQESRFVRLVNTAYSRRTRIGITRAEARNMFTYLKNRYSSAVIAKSLMYLHEHRLHHTFMIVAGIRGYRNALYFKKNNYLVVYLKAPGRHMVARVAKREGFSQKDAEKEKQIEERLFSTNKVEAIAHCSYNSAVMSRAKIVAQIRAMVEIIECKKCVNSSVNASSTIGPSGLCDVCEQYKKSFVRSSLHKERKFLLSLLRTGTGSYDAMVGISGGKDSTAMLYEVQRMGFTPLAFSLDTHYYPRHIFTRARRVAKLLGVDYEHIDARTYIRTVDRISFQKTVDLYSERDSQKLREKFRRWYVEGRRHYSIKCNHSIPFVRTCQLCRRVIVRAYYGEAQKHGVRVVILGINEWAGLSQDSESKEFVFSAIRKLQPERNKPPVYIVHLPFLLQHSIQDTSKILKKLGWKTPRGERLVESNANSCLFARAAENKAKTMLGFHPDSTRLAREVTVGFITKKQARKALAKNHRHHMSVQQVLHRAKII